MLIYFTFRHTGEPKMVLHNHGYPLGHTVTARLWQDIKHNDLHFTVSDTGWAKCAWGKIFGQWIEGACIFVYHFTGKFHATEVLPLLEKYQITTFCCPPTIYRMLILADLEKFRPLVPAPLHQCRRTAESRGDPGLEEGPVSRSARVTDSPRPPAALLPSHLLSPGPGSMGKPSPGWKIEIHDDEGSPVGDNEEGRFAITSIPDPRDSSWNTLTIRKRTKSHLSMAGITRATRSPGTMKGILVCRPGR